MRAAFFTGCSLHYFYPQTGLDLIEVLTENHIEVVVPKGQQCCGTPVLVHGDVDSARTLAKRNIDAMEDSGAAYIVTGCGSCGGAWQHESPHSRRRSGLRPEGGILERAHARHLDLPHQGDRLPQAERESGCRRYLSRLLPPEEIDERVSRAARDSARDSRRHLQGDGEAGCLLRKRWIVRDDSCGDIRLDFREKATDAAATGASTIATGCPACMMQLLDSTHRYGSKQRVRHYISLLADAYRAEKEAVEAHVDTV